MAGMDSKILHRIVAGLRVDMKDLLRDGLGQESPVSRDNEDKLEEAVMSVFMLYAQIRTGDALGIGPVVRAQLGFSQEEEEDG